MRHWLDKAEIVCSQEQFDMLCGALVRYGIYKKEDKLTDPTVEALFLFIKDQINNMQSSYEEKVEKNKKIAGRKSAFNDEENQMIYELAKSGLRVKDIAAKMGITDEKKIKAIYNSNGWKHRSG